MKINHQDEGQTYSNYHFLFLGTRYCHSDFVTFLQPTYNFLQFAFQVVIPNFRVDWEELFTFVRSFVLGFLGFFQTQSFLTELGCCQQFVNRRISFPIELCDFQQFQVPPGNVQEVIIISFSQTVRNETQANKIKKRKQFLSPFFTRKSSALVRDLLDCNQQSCS